MAGRMLLRDPLSAGVHIPTISVRVMRGLGPGSSHPSVYPATPQLPCVADRGNREGRNAPHGGQSNESKSTAMEQTAESTWAAE